MKEILPAFCDNLFYVYPAFIHFFSLIIHFSLSMILRFRYDQNIDLKVLLQFYLYCSNY